jgi:hypothetical protein
MDRTARGHLLVEKEEAENIVTALRSKLVRMGQSLAAFGRAVQQEPEGVTFANAPAGLGIIPPELAEAPPFPWESLPDKHEVACLIRELREARERLESLQRKLARRA